MKTIPRTIPILGVAVLLLGCQIDAQAQSSESYEITRSVMSGGAGQSTSPSYALTGTLG